jgi:hypothetical protein
MNDTILLIMYLEDEPEIEIHHSIDGLNTAVESYELDPACYGTDWLVALPLVMKPHFQLPSGPPQQPSSKGPDHGQQQPSPRNRTRPSRQS